MGTYRVDEDLLAAAVAKAAKRGETVTDLIVQRLQAYIRDDWTGESASAAPVAESPVYTVADTSASYEEPPAAPCRHPADAVVAGECCLCGADVW